MRKIILILIGLGIFSLQNKAQTVKDADGNVYNTVKIGSQVWFKENLKVTHYRNGEEIPKVNDSIVWKNLKKGAYCNYNKNVVNGKNYGHLYNWEATSDKRGICPKGWHIPDDAEWNALIENQGGKEVAGGKMKESGTEHWKTPNKGATNSSGFSALPGGCRSIKSAALKFVGDRSYWWSKSEEGAVFSRVLYLDYDNGKVVWIDNSGGGGYSVRCIKGNL